MLAGLREKLLEVLKAVGPLIAVVCVLQVTLVGAPLGLFLQFLAGSVLVVLGMMLLFAGVDLGILPMGRFIGADLPRRGSVTLIAAVAFGLGFATTVAEPDVLVLAAQADSLSGGAIPGPVVLYATGVGVAVFVAVAMVRVVHGFPLRVLLAAAYGVMIVLSLLAPPDFVPLAYDAGSVTTGVLTAPVVIALAVGLSAVLVGRSPMPDGFGLLGMGSIGPIIALLIIGVLLR